MVLDARLKKLASGIAVAKAARALVRSRDPAEELTTLERQQADELKATLEAMFLMAAVDGEVAAEEVEQLRASIEAIVDMHAAEGLELEPLLGEMNADLERDGWRARLEDVARRIPTDDGKAFAFRLAAGVAFVDDNVAHAEAAAIEAFASVMGIDPDTSQAIMRGVADELFAGEA
jgi:tellurite resistance protein